MVGKGVLYMWWGVDTDGGWGAIYIHSIVTEAIVIITMSRRLDCVVIDQLMSLCRLRLPHQWCVLLLWWRTK